MIRRRLGWPWLFALVFRKWGLLVRYETADIPKGFP